MKRRRKEKKAPVMMLTKQFVGNLNGKEVVLDRNSHTKRNDLRIDGSLLVSGSFRHCMFAAKNKGVKWGETPRLEPVPVE